MSFSDQVSGLATRVGTEFNTVRSEVATTTGQLANLKTSDQSNLVAAINAVASAVAAGTITSADISDATAIGKAVLTAADGPTACAAIGAYTSAQTDSAIATATANLVSSAPSTLDTLNELATALGDDPNYAATTATALGNRLRVDAAQGLTTTQQAQGQSNLDVYSTEQIGDVTTNFAAVFAAALS